VSKKRAQKVVDVTGELARRRVLEILKKERARIAAVLSEEEAKAAGDSRRSTALRAGAEDDLAVARAGRALDALGDFVDGFGRSLDEDALQKLDVAISRLEAGEPLPRGRFIESVLEDAGLRPSLPEGRERA